VLWLVTEQITRATRASADNTMCEPFERMGLILFADSYILPTPLGLYFDP